MGEMNDFEAGQAYSRNGGRLHPGQTTSYDFQAGVRSNEIHQENMKRVSEMWQAPVSIHAGSGGGGGFAGFLVFIGVVLLFLSPGYGIIAIGAGIALAILQSLPSILRSKLFWVVVILVALAYAGGHQSHH